MPPVVLRRQRTGAYGYGMKQRNAGESKSEPKRFGFKLV
jgi:hypothetical protein